MRRAPPCGRKAAKRSEPAQAKTLETAIKELDIRNDTHMQWAAAAHKAIRTFSCPDAGSGSTFTDLQMLKPALESCPTWQTERVPPSGWSAENPDEWLWGDRPLRKPESHYSIFFVNHIDRIVNEVLAEWACSNI